MYKFGIAAFALVTLLPISAQAVPYTKQSCISESWYGEQGKWVYVEGWGWGCSHRTGWPIIANGGSTDGGARVFDNGKGTVPLTASGRANGTGTPVDARAPARGAVNVGQPPSARGN